MMNDALEYYVILENCKITGDSGFDNLVSATLILDQSRPALLVHRASSHVFTIWFDDARIVCQCYQYHQIGHFWVNGQEQWRRLVYHRHYI